MFMSRLGNLIPLWGKKKKKAEFVIWEFIYELCIGYELYKENVKFYVLFNIYCVL